MMKGCFGPGCVRVKLFWLISLFGILLLACGREVVAPPPPRALVTKSLFDVFFVDGEKGWAAGKLGMIAATGDGGAFWQAQKSITDSNLRGIYFMNDQEGWVVGDLGTVLHTVNAGEEWVLLQSGTKKHLCDVYFFDRDSGFIVGEQGVVLATGNGGKDWKEREDLRELFIVEDSPFLAALFGICFVDDKTGWIAGDYGTILHTKDGGETWEKQNSGTADLLMDIYFIDGITGWAVGEVGSILHTSDGGKTWQVQESKTTYLINGIACNDGLSCFAITYGTVLHTVNGGATWEALVDDRKMWLYGIKVTGKDNIWVGADYGEILHSSDEGKHWTTQIPWE